MHAFIQGLLEKGSAWLARGVKSLARDIIGCHVAIWYLRGLRTAHRLYQLCMAAMLSAALALAGFVLFHIGLFTLLPAPANALVLMGLGLIYLVVGLCFVRALSSERRWLKAGGADMCAALADRRADD